MLTWKQGDITEIIIDVDDLGIAFCAFETDLQKKKDRSNLRL